MVWNLDIETIVKNIDAIELNFSTDNKVNPKDSKDREGTPDHSDRISSTKFPESGRNLVKMTDKKVAFSHYDLDKETKGEISYARNIGRKAPKAPQKPQAPELEVPEGIYTGNTSILYDNDDHSIDNGDRASLTKIATYLRDNPGASVVISSTTDRTASAQYNQKLSERRTDATYNALIEEMQKLGIQKPTAQASFTHNSTGESQVAGPDGKSDPNSRRTDLTITPSAEAQKQYQIAQANYANAQKEHSAALTTYQAKQRQYDELVSKMSKIEHNILVDDKSPQEFSISSSLSYASLERLTSNEEVRRGYGSVILSEKIENPVEITLEKTTSDDGLDPNKYASNIRFLVDPESPNSNIEFTPNHKNNSIAAQITSDGKTKTLAVIHVPANTALDAITVGAIDANGKVLETGLSDPTKISSLNREQSNQPIESRLNGKLNIEEIQKTMNVQQGETLVDKTVLAKPTAVGSRQNTTSNFLTV